MMKAESVYKKTSGQSIVEILISIAVITIVISAITTISFGNQSSVLDAQNRNKALQLAKNNLEENKADAKINFQSLVSTSENEGGFLKELIVTDSSQYIKNVISRVSWETQSISKKVEIATIVTDVERVLDQGGDTGGGGLGGDWQNPQTLGSVDLGPGNSATGLDVINKIVYMTASASAANKPDFFIIDTTDPQNPSIASSLDTGPTLNDVDAASNYAYVANNSTTAQLQVIDISNISSPQLISSFQLPGVADLNAVALTIFYNDSKVFLGTPELLLSPEFYVIDVSNPAAPSLIGNVEIGGDVNDIYVYDEKAYISTSLDTEELKVLDISTPSSIDEIGSYNASGGNDGKSVYLLGNTLYLGKLQGVEEFNIFNVEDPTDIDELGGTSLNADINSIVARDTLAFVGTNIANNELQILHIEDPSNITLWSSLNFPQVITALDYEDNLVYAAVRSNDALRIITSQ